MLRAMCLAGLDPVLLQDRSVRRMGVPLHVPDRLPDADREGDLPVIGDIARS